MLLMCLVLAHIPWLDQNAEDYTEQGIKRTLVTYAVARSLNGVISVAQGTEVAISPAGIGLTFAPGEILDPVNDLVERFSWVVLASGSSLGIQRIFLEISRSAFMTWITTGMILLMLLVLWFYRPADKTQLRWSVYFKQVLVWAVLIRFTVPMIAVVNEAIYVGFLQPKYEQGQLELEQASGDIKRIKDSSPLETTQQPVKNILDLAESWLNQAQQSLDIEKQMQSLKDSAERISQQVINMMVVFLLQTIIFPLLFLWGILRLGRFVMREFLV